MAAESIRAAQESEMHHGLVFWVIVGLVAGGLAKAVVPGREGGGCIGSVIVGLVGSLIGGYLFRLLLGHSFGGLVGSTVVAFVGAVVLLVIWHAFTRQRGGVDST
jgi:uncharacterized membrane protein YeaQ/YmgE (transglycosylase-associated protein family)